MKNLRIAVGALIWLGLLVAAVVYCWRDVSQQQSSTVAQLSEFILKPRHEILLQFPEPQLLYVGDPIFERRGDRYIRVGEIVSTSGVRGVDAEDDYAEQAIAEIYSSASPMGTGDQLTYYPASDSMGWVIMSLLTPKKRQKIEAILTEAYQEHFDEISEEFRPLVLQTLESAAPLIWDQLLQSIEERRAQWSEIGYRYKIELLDKQVAPLLQRTIWPATVRQFEPLVTEIGQELWSRLSLWGFGWRYMYDVSPLPHRVAVPVIESHLPEILDGVRQLLETLSANQEVRAVIANSLQAIAEDRQVRELAIGLLREVLLQNERLHQMLIEIWQSPQAQQAIRLTNDRLDYAVTSIGAELFGDPFVAITPEFSRVLRYKVLKKDFHWFLLERADPSAPQYKPDAQASGLSKTSVIIGEPSLENPFHLPAEKRR
jgi:hypothetical protein